MNKYALIAIGAVVLAREEDIDPTNAWKKVADEIFKDSKSSRDKGCPRGAFLGLCEEGAVKGIKPGNYTKSLKNKSYALKGLELILKNNKLSENPKLLWDLVVNEDKRSNSQMEIVCELYKHNLLQNKWKYIQ